MKKYVTSVIGIALSLIVFALNSSTALAADCDLTAITTVVQIGGTVQIRINGSFAGSPFEARAYNIYSPETGHWVDIGNLIGPFGGDITLPNGTNDNTGGPLFIEGQNTIVLRQAGLLGSQTDLCSTTLTASVEPPPPPEGGNCASCNATTPCRTGLSCISGSCLPGATPGQGGEGSSCVTNDQCNVAGGFGCDGGDNFWCTTNPGENAPAPGVCKKNVQTGNFNCTNRGGQCAGVISSTCQNGRTKSQCQGCWINPNDPSGANWNESMIGSCVIPDNSGCGTIGNYCCYNTTTNDFYCKEGSLGIENNPVVCKCDDNRKELGDTCNLDSDCKSNSCKGNVCSVPLDNCIPGGIDKSSCERANGIYCSKEISNTGTKLDYCCPTQGQCDQVTESNTNNFDGTCSIGGAIGISTAIGCIPIDTLNRFASFFITWGLGIGGGFSMLVFIAAAFQYITSNGDPSKLNGAKNLLTSAIAGVIFLVFSIFILRVIGVNLLGLFS